MKQIPLFYPHQPKLKIILQLIGTLNSRWWGQGPKVKRFEDKFGKKFGYSYPLFLNSGTSALELAYYLIGLKRGDEVIVPVLDCTAGQMWLKRNGIKIVFADIDDNLNIDPEDVIKKITKKTKAIVGVHLGGIPFSPKIVDLARSKNIPLITDAAQHHIGSLEGDYICYSFQAIKHFTTCDGGMLVVKDKETYDRSKKLRWFGIDRDLKEKKNYQAWERREMTFDIEEPGFKMQPTDVDACFGLAGLSDIDKVINHRLELAIEYCKNLDNEMGIEDFIVGGSAWLMGIICKQRDELAEYLRSKGIDVNLVHLRNDIYKVFGGKRQKLPNMNRLEPKYLYLPLNPRVSKKDVQYICSKIKEFYAKV